MRLEHVTQIFDESLTACNVPVIEITEKKVARLFTNNPAHEPVHTAESGEHYDCPDCIRLAK